MRRSLIAGNWKMNGSRESVDHLLQALKPAAQRSVQVEWVVFPPYIFLEQTERLLSNSLIAWGAQNMSSENNGAYTGEISGAMLADFHCQYVLVGHSERRILYGETNDQVGNKWVSAARSGLQPILCVGETLEEHQAGSTFKIVQQQLAAVLLLSHNLPVLPSWVVAYEPVWAIGTGQNAAPEQVQQMHEFIRSEVRKEYPSLADTLRIIYGGSVKTDNAKSLFAMPDVDGALVGGASLIANQFVQIAQHLEAEKITDEGPQGDTAIKLRRIT